MKSSTFILSLVVFCFVALCVVIFPKSKDYLSTFDFKYLTKNYDEGDDPFQQDQEADGCKFGFGFLRKLITKSKPKNDSPLSSHQDRPVSGAIMQKSMCLDSMDGVEGNLVSFGVCHGQGRNQEWTMTESNQIRSEGRGVLCLAWNLKKTENIVLQRCNTKRPQQKWLYDAANGNFMAAANPKLCIENTHKKLLLSTCDTKLSSQRWDFIMTEILNIKLQAQTND